MSSTSQSLDALQDIKRIMEKSGRFISLSGWSGIAAGICGLIGSALAYRKLEAYSSSESASYLDKTGIHFSGGAENELVRDLCIIAALVFVFAFLTAFLFTYRKSRQQGMAIWGASARRLLWNTLVPMAAGGFVVLRLLSLHDYLLIAPVCLIFYGLALINGSKYTLGEVRYVGYSELVLGLLNLWFLEYGLVFWALGFGVIHILYGVLMWWKYEKAATASNKPQFK